MMIRNNIDIFTQDKNCETRFVPLLLHYQVIQCYKTEWVNSSEFLIQNKLTHVSLLYSH